MLSKTALVVELELFCKSLKETVLSQYEHDVKNNIPKGIIEEDELTVERAMRMGLANSCGKLHSWGIDSTLELCEELLTEVNAHSEATRVREMREHLDECEDASETSDKELFAEELLGE